MVTVSPAPHDARPSRPDRSGRSAAAVVDRLAAVPGRQERLRHLELLPARPATHAPWPTWVDVGVRAAFVARGVARPWQHQAAAGWGGDVGAAARLQRS